MPNKYVIEVNERTQDLCMFLNDGIRPDLQEPYLWLRCVIDGPCEITTKLMSSSESMNDPGVTEETYIFLK